MRRRNGGEEAEEVRVTNLEEELDRLYTLEPDSFVAQRERLARGLRKAGQREEAEQVKRLRKPTLSAWTINQLARQERRDIDLLLDAGHRLREAQQGLLAGEDRTSLDEARRTQRDALASLRQAARRILGEAGRGNEAVLDRTMGTLQAAAVLSEGRELLARGRLTGDLEATGFELLAPFAEEVSPKQQSLSRDPLRGSGQLRGSPFLARLNETRRRNAKNIASGSRTRSVTFAKLGPSRKRRRRISAKQSGTRARPVANLLRPRSWCVRTRLPLRLRWPWSKRRSNCATQSGRRPSLPGRG